MTETVTINVPDMTCAHCEETIRSALTSVNPNANIVVDLPAQVVRVDLPAGDALAAIVDAGYNPHISAG